MVESYEPGPGTRVDAIIVPTIRRAASLRDAFELGGKLGCPMLVLSSRWSTVDAVRREAAGYDVTAIDLRPNDLPGWPVFQTSSIFRKAEYKLFALNSDLSFKRNLGLVLARMAGWERILFLDDDIVGLNAAEIESAAYGLANYEIVALRNRGFPDNSVVCHALRHVNRQLGVIQHSFIGGGAMSVAAKRSDSFFPNIYNEDWFFMLGHFAKAPGGYPVARTGNVAQQPYDPFLRAKRARVEELGDCLAEGLFALLDQKETIEQATLSYWKDFLDDRRELLSRIIAAVRQLDLEPMQKQSMLGCIQAAQGRNRFVTAALCMEYLDRWQADRVTWRTFLEGLPQPDSLDKAIGHFREAR